MCAATSSTTRSASRRSASYPILDTSVMAHGCVMRSHPALGAHVPDDVVDRVDVLRDKFLVGDLDAEPGLDEVDELDDPHRVDNATTRQRCVACDRPAI